MPRRERRVYRCPNPSCRSTKLAPIRGDESKGSRRGNQQLVYECRICGQRVGEATLERAWRQQTVND